MERKAAIHRKTKETEIDLTLSLDGKGTSVINTGIGFLDHMLEGFARHGFFDCQCQAKGDLQVDGHHTAEDIGIVLGTAIREAVGDKSGMARYGSFLLPMDEALVLCAIDISGRPYLNFDCTFAGERIGDLDTQLIHEFFYAVSYSAGMNLHIKCLAGANDHHIAEAVFKAFAKALDQATAIDGRLQDEVLSTKGNL